MASHKLDASSESSKAAEDDSKHTVSYIEAVPEKEQEASTGDLSELLEQVDEMYKTFLVSPKVVGKPQPWRSRRLEAEKEKEKENSGSPQAACVKNTNIAELDDDSPPGWQEIENLRQCMQNIISNPMYKVGDRLSAEDEVTVQSVFQFHPRAEEKTGPGIDYFKIDGIYDEDTRCFWVVRTDGTAIDFSYHKCLKAKIAREFPDQLERYGKAQMDHRRLDLKRAQRRGEDNKALT